MGMQLHDQDVDTGRIKAIIVIHHNTMFSHSLCLTCSIGLTKVEIYNVLKVCPYPNAQLGKSSMGRGPVYSTMLGMQ